MSTGRNLIVGLANSIWSALVGLAVVPFYLKYLGVEAYGLIGFFVMLQAIIQLLDMGLAPTVNREVSRCAAEGKIGKAGGLLHTLAVVYWGVAAAIALLFLVSAELVSEHWLQSKNLPSQTVTHAVILMGVVLACRWPIGLYQAALIGAHRLSVSSQINMVMVTTSSVGAVIVLAYVSATITAFFLWQACVGLIYALVMRGAAWRIVGRNHSARFDFSQIRRVGKFSLGVGGITVAGLFLTQIDKVILTKTLDLSSVGKYMIASTVASSLYIIVHPVFNIAYPKFSSLIALERHEQLLSEYGMASRLLAALLFPSAMLLILVAEPLVGLWTQNPELASEVAPVASLLLLAYALHGVMYIPHALMLAHGETRPMYPIYITLICGTVPITIAMSFTYGVMGGAAAQLLLFVSYLAVGIWVAHRNYLYHYGKTWLGRDVGVPLVLSALGWVVGGVFLMPLCEDVISQFLTGLALWVTVVFLGIYSSRGLRIELVGFWCRFRHK